MPQVPILEKRVQQEAMPGTRVSVDAPLSAFGGGASLEKVNDAFNSSVNSAKKIIEEEKKKADEVQNNATKNKLTSLYTDLQYGENGFLKKKGENIKGLPDEVNNSWSKGIEDISKGLNTEEQRAYFDKASLEVRNELNKDLQKHLFTENKEYDKNTTNSLISNLRNLAANKYNDPESVGKSLAEQQIKLSEYADRNGFGKEQKEALILDAISKTHSEVIQRTLFGQGGKAAQAYMEAHSDSISADDKIALEGKISGEVNRENGLEAWNKVKGFRLADGSLDQARGENFIMSQDIPLKDKLQQKELFHAFAAEDHQNFVRRKGAEDHKFMSDVITMRKEGKDLSEALKFTNLSTNDAYDKETRMDAVKKLYSPPSESNPEVYMNLWEKVQSGTGEKMEIDKAKAKGLINVASWEQLRKDLYKSQTGGIPAEERNIDSRIKALLKEKIGSDPEQNKLALFTINQAAIEKNMSPQEKWKFAQDSFSEVKSGEFLGIFDTHDSKWKVDLQKIDASNLAWGKAHEDVGSEQVSAIGEGVLKTKDSYAPSDLDAFAAQFGGYQNIKKGTPVNNAIKSLQMRGKPIVPENIRAVLARHPDGNY